MFTQLFSALLSCRPSETLTPPKPSPMGQARAEADAAQVLRGQDAFMTLSQRREDPAAYLALQRRRREDLTCLMLAAPAPDTLRRAIDLIGAILEEERWSEPSGRAWMDDDSHPAIDLACAETAALLGWCARILGESLDTSITARMRGEVRRRVLRPAMMHDDYPFMVGEGACPMAVCADILIAAMLLESEESRLARVLKPVLRMLDDACGRHGRALVPLADAVTDISAVTDLAVLIQSTLLQSVNLTQKVPAGDWLDELLYPWIQDDWFNDPAGDGMRPALSGGDLFRVGAAAQDEPLTCLGAHLHHLNHIPSRTVTGRIMEAAGRDALESAFGQPKRLRYAALRGNLLMASRIPGLYCSLHTGGGRGNAGDICLFAGSSPILVDGGRDVPARSVPMLAGHDQLPIPAKPCIADFETRQDREILSVDLTSAYPESCKLRSYQRTVLTLPRERVVRVLDAVDFAFPAMVTFRFVSAAKPTLLTDAIRFGSVRMTWEGDFTAAAQSLSPTLTLVELTSAQPVRQAYYSFIFTAPE